MIQLVAPAWTSITSADSTAMQPVSTINSANGSVSQPRTVCMVPPPPVPRAACAFAITVHRCPMRFRRPVGA
jgi:hypothetical protein